MNYEKRSEAPRRFFAASNSSEGFHNDYGVCFGEGSGVEQLYIVKGGPGTGKSHFLRTVGRYAEKRGYTATYYYCSSDPASLDGVRLEADGKPCIGLLDGTAPHVCEPVIPGVREEIVNLGVFWDSERLRAMASEIKALSEQKSACYSLAYRYLAACGETDAIADTLISPCVLHKKLAALAERLLRSQPVGKGFVEIPAHLRAVGMTGKAYFDTFVRLAEEKGGHIVRMEDYYGLAYRVTARLHELSREKGHRVMVSRNPVHIHKIDGLYYPDTGLCVLVGDEAACDIPHREVSLRRYVDPQRLKELRGKIRHAGGLTRELLEGACHSLSSAGKYHFELEKIYSSAMDFSAKERFDRDFCQKLFGK